MREKLARTAPILALRQRFLERAGRDAITLEAALERFSLDPDSLHEIAFLRDKAHALIGGLWVFGFEQAAADAESFSTLLASPTRDPKSLAREGTALSATLRLLSFELPTGSG